MGPVPAFNWPLWLSVGLLAAIGLALLIWALVGDRSRGRRRCPKCWYDMRGSPTLRCPECGHVVWNEGELYRSRRRRKTAWLAILMLLATVALPIVQRVRTHGWPSILPTSVLLWMAAPAPQDDLWIAEDTDSPLNPVAIADELSSRVSVNELSDDAEMALTDWEMDTYWAGQYTLPLADVLVGYSSPDEGGAEQPAGEE